MQSEYKAFLSFSYIALLSFNLFLIFYADKPPILLFAIFMGLFVVLSIFGAISFNGLKTYNLIVKQIVFVLTIIICISLVIPTFNVLRDLSKGSVEKSCTVLQSYEIEVIKGKDERDGKKEFVYKCADGEVLSKSYFKYKNILTEKIFRQVNPLSISKPGDKQIIKYYPHSDILVYVKTSNGNFENNITLFHIIFMITLILMLIVIYKIKEEDFNSLRYINSINRKFNDNEWR